MVLIRFTSIQIKKPRRLFEKERVSFPPLPSNISPLLKLEVKRLIEFEFSSPFPSVGAIEYYIRRGEKMLESYSSNSVKSVSVPFDADEARARGLGWIARGGKEGLLQRKSGQEVNDEGGSKDET